MFLRLQVQPPGLEKQRLKYTKRGEKSERDSEILNKRMRDRKIIISCIPGTDTDAWEKIK